MGTGCSAGWSGCGHCGVGVSCHRMRGRNGTLHRYYYCNNHDPVRAGGEHRRCPERNIRADELDSFVFEQVRNALLRPETLLAGESAVSSRRTPVADELLEAQLVRLGRNVTPRMPRSGALSTSTRQVSSTMTSCCAEAWRSGTACRSWNSGVMP